MIDTVAVKSAEDAPHWGVHLSAAQRDAMDALVERLVALWGARAATGGPEDLAWRDPAGVFALWLATDSTVDALQQGLHFDHAAKRYGFFLQYLGDALHAEALRLQAHGQTSAAEPIHPGP